MPKYCRHAPTGQGYVRIAGRQIYLGPYGSEASMARYAVIVAKWRAGQVDAVNAAVAAAGEMTVINLVSRYLSWARGRYRKGELTAHAVGVRRLLALHADTPVRQFGPLALQEVRTLMVTAGLTRGVINAAVHRIRRIWRWGVRNELLEGTRWRALLSVPALAAGEEGVRESVPVRPASWRQVRAVLRRAPMAIRRMVRLQILTGMRPGELVILRPMDVEISSAGWTYRPQEHKGKAAGRERPVHLGPRARALLGPLLAGLRPDQYVFRPADAVEAWRARPCRCGARTKARRLAVARWGGRKPKRLHEAYSTGSYRTAIRRACEAAYPLPAELARAKGESAALWKARLGPEGMELVWRWRREHILHPHQLRHSFATRIGRLFGRDDARILLGHADLATTDIYVERDVRRGRSIIEQAG